MWTLDIFSDTLIFKMLNIAILLHILNIFVLSEMSEFDVSSNLFCVKQVVPTYAFLAWGEFCTDVTYGVQNSVSEIRLIIKIIPIMVIAP